MKQDLGLLTRSYVARQWSVIDVFKELNIKGVVTLCDLGCGTGRSYDQLIKLVPEMEYVGVDIEGSDESRSRQRTDIEVVNYDGVNIPFPDDHFDIVFCDQVFEHVRYQEGLLKDIRRVLKSQGFFVGSLSGIEPYHSHSMFNLTPFGWLAILNDNGFQLKTLRPGIDGLTLVKRHYSRALGVPYKVPAIGEMNEAILDLELSDKEKNRLMLNLAGHMIFVARPIK